MLVSLTTSVTLSRISFTSVQIASRVEEASAEATFDKMVSPSLTDTSYAAEAVPFFRVVYVLVTGTDIEGPGFDRLIICDLASVVCALPLGTAPAGSFGVQGTHTGMLHRRAPEHGHDLPT